VYHFSSLEVILILLDLSRESSRRMVWTTRVWYRVGPPCFLSNEIRWSFLRSKV